jgi:hypothetical protein
MAGCRAGLGRIGSCWTRRCCAGIWSRKGRCMRFWPIIGAGPAALVYEPGRRHRETVVVEPLVRLDDDLVLAVAFALLEHL